MNERKAYLGMLHALGFQWTLQKPLRKGMHIRLGNQSQTSKIFFKYKHLVNFCYACGSFDHLLNECETHKRGEEDEDNLVLPYRVWMKASLQKNTVITECRKEVVVGRSRKHPSLQEDNRVIE